MDKLALYKRTKPTKQKSKSINSDLEMFSKSFSTIKNNKSPVKIDLDQSNYQTCKHQNKFSLNFASVRSLSKKSDIETKIGYKSTAKKSLNETEEMLSEKAELSA